MADLGYTFEPGTDQKKLLTGINRGRLGPMANEALRVISLKLPTVLGGSPIAPEDMIRPRVGGSGPGGAVLDSLRTSATPGPAPLVTGAGSAPGALSVAKFPGAPGSSPFGATPSDLGDLGTLAQNAVNPPQGPTFTPGEGLKPQVQPPMPGPGSSTSPSPAPTDLFGAFMHRLLNHGSTGNVSGSISPNAA